MSLAACGRIDFDPRAAPVSDARADALEFAIPPGAGIWLRMETDPTVSIIDSAGGHTVTCTTCPTRVAGVHGSGYQFVMEQVTVADAPDLDSSSGYSAGIWFELDAYPAPGNVATLWNKPFDNAAGYDTYNLFIDDAGTLIFDSEDLTGTTTSFNGPTVPLLEWHHVAATWDGVTKRGYVDGLAIGSVPATSGTGIEPFGLGADRLSPIDFASAIVDDAVFYTRALSVAEIQLLATRG